MIKKLGKYILYALAFMGAFAIVALLVAEDEPTDNQPTAVPTRQPTAVPTHQPTAVPTRQPTAVPTKTPSPEEKHGGNAKDIFYEGYMEGCDDGTNTRFCDCTWRYMEKRIGVAGLLEISQEYAETGIQPPILLDAAAYCSEQSL